MSDYVYFAGDVESSRGTVVPPQANMVSFALCEVGKPEESFYAELKPIFPGLWDWRTEDIHLITRGYLEQYGKDPREVMENTARWVREVVGDRIAVYCAMPIAFDWEYMDWYFRYAGVTNPFLRTLDGRAQFRALYGIPTHAEVPRERVWKAFPTDVPHTHHALSDTLEYEQVVAGMLRAAGKL